MVLSRVPPNSDPPETVNVGLSGNRIFTDGIKSHWVGGVLLSSDQCPCKKEIWGHTHIHSRFPVKLDPGCCEGGGGSANKKEASGNLPPPHWWEVRGLLQRKEEPDNCFEGLSTLDVGMWVPALLLLSA